MPSAPHVHHSFHAGELSAACLVRLATKWSPSGRRTLRLVTIPTRQRYIDYGHVDEAYRAAPRVSNTPVFRTRNRMSLRRSQRHDDERRRSTSRRGTRSAVPCCSEPPDDGSSARASRRSHDRSRIPPDWEEANRAGARRSHKYRHSARSVVISCDRLEYLDTHDETCAGHAIDDRTGGVRESMPASPAISSRRDKSRIASASTGLTACQSSHGTLTSCLSNAWVEW